MCSLCLQSKTQRQPTNTVVVVVETKEPQPHPLAPLPVAETRKSEPPTTQTTPKPTQDIATTTVASFPTTVPPAITSAPPPIVPTVSFSSSHLLSLTSVPSTEPVASRPVEGGGVLGGQSDVGGGADEKPTTVDPQLTKESSKPVIPLESAVRLLESSSTSSLLNSPISTSEESAPSPPSDQDQQPPPPTTADKPLTNELTMNMSSHTGQERERVPSVASAAVQEVGKVDEAHGLPGTNGGKKKAVRGKGRMTLTLIEVTPDDVVKCALVTKNDVKINFQFSSKFDQTKAIFNKLVSSDQYMYV